MFSDTSIVRHTLLLAPEDVSGVCARALTAAGWELSTARDLRSAGQTIAQHPLTVGLTFLDPHHEEPDSALEAFILDHPDVEWIALLAPCSMPSQYRRRLLTTVFYDYHTLPLDLTRLLFTMGHAYGKLQLKDEPLLAADTEPNHKMIGVSPAMQSFSRALAKVAPVGAPVLITGENGTGKELAAETVHRLSTRAPGPFVAVNCGALPAHLVQSELFGHEKGAFTGAHRRKVGWVEAAHGGSIFLDEIGDLPLDLQVNLLRFLQDSIIERIGSTTRIPVDVRILAATHIDLEEAVAKGRFREDLYYRLNVLRLELPPLRERSGDIERLARFYFVQFSRQTNIKAQGFSQRALRAMNEYHWPGNVRELINRIQRAAVMSENRLLTPLDLGLEPVTLPSSSLTLQSAREQADAGLIQQTLHRTQYNVSRAARELGISRATLYRLISKLKVSPPADCL